MTEIGYWGYGEWSNNLVLTRSTIVGVVGPEDLVDRILSRADVISELPKSVRLRAVPYRYEGEMLGALSQVVAELDSVLFTGPVAYRRGMGVLDTALPSTFIPLGSSSLISGLARWANTTGSMPLSVSVDSLDPPDVQEALEDLGLDPGVALVLEGVEAHVASSENVVDFHRDLHTGEGGRVAVTGLRSVADALAEVGIACIRLEPSTEVVRSSVWSAVLLGFEARALNSRVSMLAVDLGVQTDPEQLGSIPYLGSRLAETSRRAEQLLSEECREYDLVATRIDPMRFTVFGAIGDVLRLTDGLRLCPFRERLARLVGDGVRVGIGVTSSAGESERNAWRALAETRPGEGFSGCALFESGESVLLSNAPSSTSRRVAPALRARDRELLERLQQFADRVGAAQTAAADTVVNAKQVGDALGLSVRSSRRLLTSLVEQNMAWDLPPERGSGAGRPEKRWRLRLSANDDASRVGDFESPTSE